MPDEMTSFVYINDLKLFLNKHKTALFADDTKITVSAIKFHESVTENPTQCQYPHGMDK